MEARISKMLNNNFFSVCDLDAVVDMLEIPKAAEKLPTYKQLRALHCISYKEMVPALREAIPQLIVEHLRAGRAMREGRVAKSMTERIYE